MENGSKLETIKIVILWVGILSFVTWAIIGGITEQRNLDNYGLETRAVVVSVSRTQKGPITQYEFVVDGKKYKGGGGGRAGRAVVGDSLYIRYASNDPSVSSILYSEEYSNPPSKTKGRDLFILLSAGVIVVLLTIILAYKYEIKKEKNPSENAK